MNGLIYVLGVLHGAFIMWAWRKADDLYEQATGVRPRWRRVK